MDYEPSEGLPPMPEFGMLLKLDADYDRLDYYGNGPLECYTDRDKGARLGIYHTTVGDNMTRYLVPQECGNRTGVRWAKVTNRRGHGLLFTAERKHTGNEFFGAALYACRNRERAASHGAAAGTLYGCPREPRADGSSGR